MKPSKQNLLYILECDSEKFFKIGVTKDVDSLERRIKSLQTGNPHRINIAYYDERTASRQAEKYLHQVLDEYRVVGEWFTGITLKDIRIKLMLFLEQN